MSNKERYSIATKNLLPIEEKCEILSLPKSIQIIRKELKQGRLLISNLQESKLKFLGQISSETKPETAPRIKNVRKEEIKAKLMDIETIGALNRGNVRSSASNGNRIDFVSGDYRLLRMKKSQSQMNNCDPYAALEGFEIDNLAMTITTFKRPK
jgi:hypothetical protein